MTDPLSLTAKSPRFGLPLLFAGQAQKEFTVNEALSLTDALLHCAIEGTLAVPPAIAAEGLCWLVGSSPEGDWVGHGGELACRQGGTWLFIHPTDGMRILDRSTGQFLSYRAGWNIPATPAGPTGGSTVDSEARACITALIGALQLSGILAPD